MWLQKCGLLQSWNYRVKDTCIVDVFPGSGSWLSSLRRKGACQRRGAAHRGTGGPRARLGALLSGMTKPACRAVLMRKCPREAQGLQVALLGTHFGETTPATSTDTTSVSETQPRTRRLSRPLSLLANTTPPAPPTGFLTSCLKSVCRVSLVGPGYIPVS